MGCAAALGAQGSEDALLLRLETRWEVLRLVDGYALRSREPIGDLEVVEVARGRVGLDGRQVGPEELRRQLGEDAETVLQLAELTGRTSSRLGERGEGLAEEITAEIEESLRRRLERLEELRDGRLRELEERLEQAGRRRSAVGPSIRTGDRIRFGRTLRVPPQESVGELVAVGGSIEVDGVARENAVAVGGSVRVRGEVRGDVVSVGGAVVLGPGAEVGGDVTSVGGPVRRDPSARVRGAIQEISLAPLFLFDDVSWHPPEWTRWPWSGWRWGWGGGVGRVLERIGNAVFLAALVLLLYAVARRWVTSIADRVEEEPWKAGLVGLVAELLILCLAVLGVVIALVLLVSIVGIPLLLILLPVVALVGGAIALGVLGGYAGLALSLGRLVERRLKWRQASPYLLALTGVGLIHLSAISGQTLDTLWGPVRLVGLLLIVVGILIYFVVATVGFGAVLLHQFSPRPPALAAPSLPAGEPPAGDDDDR